ncbi:MAG: DUF4625 domain-containing protein [Bacteroidia bacterium]|nr:DUF4625 domain-containing protein [Bacteroidia bacterium]
MKNKFSFFAIACFSLLISLYSCKHTDPPATQEDVKDPWIIMSSPKVVPLGEWNYLNDGEYFDVDIRFEDDVELSNYKVQISYNSQLNYLKTNNDSWEKIEVGFLDGKSDGINTSYKVSEDPNAGPYEFKVTVWDKAGKETTLVTYLFLKNQRDTLVPVFTTITKPNPNVVDTIWGDTLYVKGTVTDNNGVEDAYIRLRTIDLQLVEGSEVFLDTLFAGSYQIDTFLDISKALPGDHLVEFYANDNLQNVGRKIVPVYVK